MTWRTSLTLVFWFFRFFLPIPNASLRYTYDFRYFLYSHSTFQEFQCPFSTLCQLFTFSVGSHAPYYDTSSEINSLKFSKWLKVDYKKRRLKQSPLPSI